ncbi:ACO1_2 [Sanghuangporus weigelae]
MNEAQPDDRMTMEGLERFARSKNLIMEFRPMIEWFKAGSALDSMAKQANGNQTNVFKTLTREYAFPHISSRSAP